MNLQGDGSVRDVDGPYGRFFQIGYVTRDLATAAARLTQMGARRIDYFEDFKRPNGDPSAIWGLSHMARGGAELELIQPRLDRTSIYLDALPEESGAIALHHVGYLHPDVPAWEAAMARVRASGATVVSEGAMPQARFAYLDTRADLGHFTEVVWRQVGSLAERD